MRTRIDLRPLPAMGCAVLRLAACGLALWVGASTAEAQSGAGPGGGIKRGAAAAPDPTDPGGDAAIKPNQGMPLPGGGNTKDLTMPGQGGVADTGLGGSTGGTGNGAVSGKPSRDTGAAGVSGTGMSVKGAAGQGIDGQGVSDGITASPTGNGGGTSGSGGAAAGGGAPAGSAVGR